ncbi:hypothetical protein EVAR_47412_1 [Eumeta japonica]|uniref:Uncharacterized protein n=1 Tax=Eumeta variegata TaxID=151549 RepID=A0A4C1Y3M5_EUMVA|nr:hypothetical protein EVAR_47412_1 [Eumeta japonica]
MKSLRLLALKRKTDGDRHLEEHSRRKRENSHEPNRRGAGPGKLISGFFLDTRPCCNAATASDRDTRAEAAGRRPCPGRRLAARATSGRGWT